MSILINTQSEQEEKVIVAFLDSLAIEYKRDVEEQAGVSHNFIQ